MHNRERKPASLIAGTARRRYPLPG